MTRLRLVGLPLLAVAVLPAACGGEDKLSKAEYVEQADAICQKYADKQKALGDPKSVADVQRLADETKPLVTGQLDELRDLAAPDDIADDAKAAYDLLDQQVPKIDELAAAAKENDAAAIQKIATEAGAINKQANAKAKTIGLKVCGKE